MCNVPQLAEQQQVQTERQLLPGVRREGEAEQGHAGDEDAGDDQVEEVVESPPPDPDGEGDVHVGLRAAVVDDAVSSSWHSYDWYLIEIFMS